MMTETVRRGLAKDALPDFEVMKKFLEDDSKGKTCEREITALRELHSREDHRDPELRKRTVHGHISRRWPRRMNLDEIYRTPSLFTWRC